MESIKFATYLAKAVRLVRIEKNTSAFTPKPGAGPPASLAVTLACKSTFPVAFKLTEKMFHDGSIIPAMSICRLGMNRIIATKRRAEENTRKTMS